MAAVGLAFPTKPDLLKAALDVAIAGDDGPIPVPERPWAPAAGAAPDATAFLDAVATVLVPVSGEHGDRPRRDACGCHKSRPIDPRTGLGK